MNKNQNLKQNHIHEILGFKAMDDKFKPNNSKGGKSGGWLATEQQRGKNVDAAITKIGTERWDQLKPFEQAQIIATLWGDCKTMTENYLDEQLKQSYSKLVHEAHTNLFLTNYLLSLQKRIEENEKITKDNEKQIQNLRQYLSDKFEYGQ